MVALKQWLVSSIINVDDDDSVQSDSQQPLVHQGPVLSPLKKSPLCSKEEPSKWPEEPHCNMTCVARVCVLTAAWAEQFLSRMITDGRQPEAITNAQVTKVANGSADTKSAAEETPQTAKKVPIMLNGYIFSAGTTLK